MNCCNLAYDLWKCHHVLKRSNPARVWILLVMFENYVGNSTYFSLWSYGRPVYQQVVSSDTSCFHTMTSDSFDPWKLSMKSTPTYGSIFVQLVAVTTAWRRVVSSPRKRLRVRQTELHLLVWLTHMSVREVNLATFSCACPPSTHALIIWTCWPVFMKVGMNYVSLENPVL